MKIPQRTDTGVQEQPLQGGEWRVNPGDFGQENIEKTNRAMQGIASAAEKNTRAQMAEAERIAIKAQQEADETVQLEAGTIASQKELEWNNKTRTTKGKNALGLADEFESDWSKFVSETKNSLVKNKKQEMMVDRILSSNYAQLRNNIDAHTAKEMDSFYDEQSTAMISADRKTAIDSGNPERIAESIGKQKAILSMLAKKKGWSDEESQLKMLTVERDTKMEYVQRLAYTDSVAARAMIEDEDERKILGDENIETLSSFISKAEREKTAAVKNLQINNDIQFMSDFSTGKIQNISDIEKVASPGLAKAAIAYLSDPKLIDEEDTPIFSTYVEELYELDDKEAINKLFIDVLSGGPDGKINQQELESLVKIAGTRAGKMKPKKNFVSAALDTVKRWSEKYETKNAEGKSVTRTILYKELFGEVEKKEPQSAEDAQKVAAKVIEKAQTMTNPNRTAYQVDQIYDFPAGKGICVGYREDGTPIFKKAK